VLQSVKSQQYERIVLLDVWLIQCGRLYSNAVSSSAASVHWWVVIWTIVSDLAPQSEPTPGKHIWVGYLLQMPHKNS